MNDFVTRGRGRGATPPESLFDAAREFTLAEEDVRLSKQRLEQGKRVLRSWMPDDWRGVKVVETTFTLRRVEEMGWLTPGRAQALRELVEPGRPWPPERAYVARLLNAPHALSESCWCDPVVETVDE